MTQFKAGLLKLSPAFLSTNTAAGSLLALSAAVLTDLAGRPPAGASGGITPLTLLPAAFYAFHASASALVSRGPSPPLAAALRAAASPGGLPSLPPPPLCPPLPCRAPAVARWSGWNPSAVFRPFGDIRTLRIPTGSQPSRAAGTPTPLHRQSGRKQQRVMRPAVARAAACH